MNWIVSVVTKICKVPQKFAPELEDPVGTQKNKCTFLLLFLMFVGRGIRYLQMGRKTPELIYFLNCVFLLAVFILVCRKRRWIFNLGLAGLMGFTIVLNSFGKDGFQFANIESCLSIAFFIIGLSQNIFISFILFCLQVYAIHSKSHDVMLEAIRQLPPEVILKVFMNIVNLYGPVIFLTNVYNSYALDSTTSKLVDSNNLANSALQQMKTFV